MGSQDGGHFSGARTAGCGWIEMDAVDPPHRVSGDELVTIRSGAEARDRGLLAGLRCRRQVRNGHEEAAQDLRGDRRGEPAVEADKAAEVGGVGTPRMYRSVGVGQVGEEVSDEVRWRVLAITMPARPLATPPAELVKRSERV